MTWFNNLSIKSKLTILILGITLFSQIISFSIITIERLNYLNKELLNQSHVQAKLISEYCVSPIVFEDMDGLNQILQKSKALPFILSVAVYDQSGDLLTFHQNREGLDPIPEHAMYDDTHTKHMLHVREEINHDGIEYGQIHLKVSTEQLRKTIYQQILIFVLIVIGTIFLIYFVTKRFQRIISEPIINLAAFTDKISQTADYSLQIQKQSEDETGKLYDNFNNLIKQIKTKSKERDLVLEKLQNSTEKLDLALSGGETGVWEWDLKTDITIWDARMEKMFGLNVGEFKQNYEAFKELLHPDDILHTEKAIKNALEDISPYNTVYRVIWKNNDIRYVKAMAIVSKDNSGKALKMTGVCFDFTEVKKAEEELKLHQEQLEELVSERTEKLEEKNSELENMNNVFVDREYRIKELKDRLKEFENKSTNK